jgi:hypothetical protein
MNTCNHKSESMFVHKINGVTQLVCRLCKQPYFKNGKGQTLTTGQAVAAMEKGKTK